MRKSLTGGNPILRGAGEKTVPDVLQTFVSSKDMVVFKTTEEGAVVPTGCLMEMEVYQRGRLGLEVFAAGTRFWVYRRKDEDEGDLAYVEVEPPT